MITQKKKRKVECPKCGSDSVIKFGFKLTKKGKKQRYQCQKCAQTFY